MIADLLQTEKKHIVIEHMNTQLQKGGDDCGLFAIAAATALCHGEDPVEFKYEQSLMRSHLHKAFKIQALLLFPSMKTHNRRKTPVLCWQHIAVYCICRLPDDGW